MLPCFWRVPLSAQRVVKCFSWVVMKSAWETHFRSGLVTTDVELLGWREKSVCLGTLNRHCRTSSLASGEILSILLTFNSAIEGTNFFFYFFLLFFSSYWMVPKWKMALGGWWDIYIQQGFLFDERRGTIAIKKFLQGYSMGNDGWSFVKVVIWCHC